MAVSKGARTRSSQKTVLPVDADRTMVVLAHKLAPPHIIETLPDCTLTPVDTRTRPRVPVASREILRNSHRGRLTSSMIRKTASRRFWDPKPHTPGRDPVWARGGYGMP